MLVLSLKRFIRRREGGVDREKSNSIVLHNNKGEHLLRMWATPDGSNRVKLYFEGDMNEIGISREEAGKYKAE